MDYCYDNDLRLLDSEVDSEGKPGHQRTARIAMNYRICQRLFRNELESRKCFVQEFVPEILALLLVPRSSCG
jgi:hypothetical protein